MTGQPPVVVVGAGPTGLTAALLLARQGVPCIVLERHPGIYPLPRAVHLDDEVYRILQAAGVGDAFAAITRPAAGLRLVDGRHRVLADFTRRSAGGRHGLPQANMFDQPELEQLLRDELARSPQVLLRSQTEVLAVAPGQTTADPLLVSLRDLRTGAEEELAASAVLGCDGANSLVRETVQAAWRDLRFEQEWLVVDARCAQQLAVWDGVHQVCDSFRAATFMQIGPDRYRWEFQLRPTDDPAELVRPERVAELVRPWLRETPGAELKIMRDTTYTFRARLADRWSLGRVFLLGDAAHLTPPFIGQGMGAGLRDAANLSWKLAAVLQGRAPEQLLATYELERRPHARALIRTAVVLGWAMTGGRGSAAAARRAVLAGLMRVGPVRQGLLDRGSPPLARGPLVRRRPGRARLVGTLAPQPDVCVDGRVRRLDDVLGPGFAVLSSVDVDAALDRIAGRLGAPVLRLGRDAVDDRGVLTEWLRAAGVTAAVLRPDRTVLLTATSEVEPGYELERDGAAVLRLVCP